MSAYVLVPSGHCGYGQRKPRSRQCVMQQHPILHFNFYGADIAQTGLLGGGGLANRIAFSLRNAPLPVWAVAGHLVRSLLTAKALARRGFPTGR